MEIQKAAVAGTLESSDAQVTVEPGAGGVQRACHGSFLDLHVNSSFCRSAVFF